MIRVKRKFYLRREPKGRKVVTRQRRADVGDGVPRVAKLMALAIYLEQLVTDGDVADYAELARLGQVTRARLTQIVNLLNLAPSIQEEVLFFRVGNRVTERGLRQIAAELDWGKQKRIWKTIKG